MTFRVRYRQHDFHLGPEPFVVGRGHDCQLVVDDSRVSRRHVSLWVEGGKVVLEDLGSSNGTQVNGAPVAGRAEIAVGDRVQVGDQELLLVGPREEHDSAPAVSRARRNVPTMKIEGFGVVGHLADKALAMKQAGEAERLLQPVLGKVLAGAQQGAPVAPVTVDRAGRYALELAVQTGKGTWVEWVFDLYTALRVPMSQELVDQLYDVVRKAPSTRASTLAPYVDFYRDAATTPAQRFLLSRLEGLLRLIAHT